jgi:CheY-like chemotaxis protein
MKSSIFRPVRFAIASLALAVIVVDVVRHAVSESPDAFGKNDIVLFVIACAAAGLNVRYGKLEISSKERSEAAERLQRAQKEKKAPELTADAASAAVARAVQPRLIRTLWIDEHPRNNLQETLMLETLGFAVTNVLGIDDAEPFLKNVPFELVISSMTQGGDSAAGGRVVETAKTAPNRPPVVIYRGKQDDVSKRALDQGAHAVVTTPYELLTSVHTALAQKG